MLDHVIYLYDFNLKYANNLLKGIPEVLLCQQTAGIKNHPLWQIGHLANSSNNGCKMLGLEDQVPNEWPDLFGIGSQPVNDSTLYPSLNQVWQVLEDQHDRLSHFMQTADLAILKKPQPWDRLKSMFPTIGSFVCHIMTTHEANHLGQLSAWRKANGFKPLV